MIMFRKYCNAKKQNTVNRQQFTAYYKLTKIYKILGLHVTGVTKFFQSLEEQTYPKVPIQALKTME